MKIEINQAEIEAAIVAYVGSQGIDVEGKDVGVDMVAGRGANGYTASITLTDKTASVELKEVGSEEGDDNTPDSANLFNG